jgi:hypothetical protein
VPLTMSWGQPDDRISVFFNPLLKILDRLCVF